MYKKDSTSVPRILDIVQEAKVCIFITILIYVWIKQEEKFAFINIWIYKFFLPIDFGTYFTC